MSFKFCFLNYLRASPFFTAVCGKKNKHVFLRLCNRRYIWFRILHIAASYCVLRF